MGDNEKVTAFLDEFGDLTGEYQRGDWSRHQRFDARRNIVMTMEEFNAKVSRQNARAQRAAIISEDEIWMSTSQDFLNDGGWD